MAGDSAEAIERRGAGARERRRSRTENLLETTHLAYTQVEVSDSPTSSAANSPNWVRPTSKAASPLGMRGGAKLFTHKFRSGVRVQESMRGAEVSVLKQSLTDDAKEDVDAILHVLSQGLTRKLNLANNLLGDKAAVEVARALALNTSLEMLSLHGNNIGSEGAAAFAHAIKQNTSLKSLYLSSNLLSKADMAALVEANAERPQPMSGLGGLVLGGSRNRA